MTTNLDLGQNRYKDFMQQNGVGDRTDIPYVSPLVAPDFALSGIKIADDTVELDGQGWQSLYEAAKQNQDFFIREGVSYVVYINERDSLPLNPASLSKWHFTACGTITGAVGTYTTDRFMGRAARAFNTQELFALRNRKVDRIADRHLYVCGSCMIKLKSKTGKERDRFKYSFLNFCKEFADEPMKLLRNIHDQAAIERDIIGNYVNEARLRQQDRDGARGIVLPPQRPAFNSLLSNQTPEPGRIVYTPPNGIAPTGGAVFVSPFRSKDAPPLEPEPTLLLPTGDRSEDDDFSWRDFGDMPDDKKPKYNPDFQEKSKAFKHRHGNYCDGCQSRFEFRFLETHHDDRDSLNDDESNWLILCPVCHCKEHTRDGKTKKANKRMSHSYVADRGRGNGSRMGDFLAHYPQERANFDSLARLFPNGLPEPVPNPKL